MDSEPLDDDLLIDPGAEDFHHLSLVESYNEGWMGVEIYGRFVPVDVKPRYWRIVLRRDYSDVGQAGSVPSSVGLAFFERPEDLEGGGELGRDRIALLTHGRLADGKLDVLGRRFSVEQDHVALLKAPLGRHLGHVVRRESVLFGLRVEIEREEWAVRFEQPFDRLLQLDRVALHPLALEVFARLRSRRDREPMPPALRRPSLIEADDGQ